LLETLGNIIEETSQRGGWGSEQELNAGREDELNFSISVDMDH
jgi:hypothetical protein